MRQWVAGFVCAFTLLACVQDQPDKRPFYLSPDNITSGLTFLTEETQALQKDDFLNPGYLWVERGEALFRDTSTKMACADCHESPKDNFKLTAVEFPRIDDTTGELRNVQGQINHCRTERQDLEPLPYESEALLSLTSFVKTQSLGATNTYTIETQLEPYFTQGREYFYTRRGQLNLSCHQCHDQNWGQRMRGDTVSQGHINGFPLFRNDWQTLGSAHRRFAVCDESVRAEPYALGSEHYLALEVYLMARGRGLEVETPAMRR